MIKKTYNKTKSTNQSTLQASLVCETSFIPIPNKQQSIFQQSIGYSEHLLLENPSQLLQRQLERDRQYLEKQKGSMNRNKVVKELKKQTTLENQSVNQFLIVQKATTGVKNVVEPEEVKNGKWSKPKVINKANFNFKAKQLQLQKQKQQQKQRELLKQQEQVFEETNNFSEIGKVIDVRDDMGDYQEQEEGEESLLISKSRYDIPQTFVSQPQMLSEYMESGDNFRWEEVKSEVFRKEGRSKGNEKKEEQEEVKDKNQQQENRDEEEKEPLVIENQTMLIKSKQEEELQYKQGCQQVEYYEQQEQEEQLEDEQEQQEEEEEEEEEEEQQEEQESEQQQQQSQQQDEQEQSEQQEQDEQSQQEQQQQQQQQDEEQEQTESNYQTNPLIPSQNPVPQTVQQASQQQIQDQSQYIGQSMIDVYTVEILPKLKSQSMVQLNEAHHHEQIPDESMCEQSYDPANKTLQSNQQKEWVMAQKTISDLKSLISDP